MIHDETCIISVKDSWVPLSNVFCGHNLPLDKSFRIRIELFAMCGVTLLNSLKCERHKKNAIAEPLQLI